MSAVSQAWGGAAVITPNAESVKEIRVVSSSYSADSGGNAGAQVQVVSQNGTNDLHGSFVFKRNTPGLNAYQKWGGPHGEAPQRANQLQSQTAGSLGGPILRDKLFFFFSYEGQRQDKNSLTTAWVETPELVAAINAQRAGSLATQFLNYPGMTPPRVATVLETRDLGSLTGALGQPVTEAAGGGLDGIPDVQRAQLEGFSKTTAQQFNTRVDYSVTQNDRLAFSMFYVPVNTRSNDAGANSARPMGDFLSERRNMAGTLLWTRTLSPTMINEARFNVMRWYFDEIASNPDTPWGLPRLQVNQPAGENLLLTYGPGVGPGVFYQTSYNFRDTLTKVLNSHALKFGVDIVAEQNNDKAPWAGRPTYSFDNLWSFANDAPSSEGTTFFDPDDRSVHRSDRLCALIEVRALRPGRLEADADAHRERRPPLGLLCAAAEQERPDLESRAGPERGSHRCEPEARRGPVRTGPQQLRAAGGVCLDARPLQPEARVAWRLRDRLQPASGFAAARITVQPAVLRGVPAEGPGHPLCTGGNRHRLRLPTQPGCDADVRSSDQPSGDRSARERERDAAGPAQSVHAAVLGGLRVRPRRWLGRRRGLPGQPRSRAAPHGAVPTVRRAQPETRHGQHAASRRIQPLQRAADAYQPAVRERVPAQCRVPVRPQHGYLLERSELPADVSLRSVHRVGPVGLRRDTLVQAVWHVGSPNLQGPSRRARVHCRWLAAERNSHRQFRLPLDAGVRGRVVSGGGGGRQRVPAATGFGTRAVRPRARAKRN